MNIPAGKTAKTKVEIKSTGIEPLRGAYAEVDYGAGRVVRSPSVDLAPGQSASLDTVFRNPEARVLSVREAVIRIRDKTGAVLSEERRTL